MGKFKYSDEELNINKVLKMNQTESLSIQNDEGMRQIRESADDSISSSYELLNKLNRKDLVPDRKQKPDNAGNKKLENRPKLETWDEILAQACRDIPDQIELEDIMTEREIQAAFDEREAICKEFSRKTGIINKTDLSFLAIATALQVCKTMIFLYFANKLGYGDKFDPSNRLAHNDKSIENAHKEANDKFKNSNIKKNGTGYWINILYQTPPYDITKGSAKLGINMGGKAHRLYTLGHDPVLGWLFGTANILTDCITFNSLITNRVQRLNPVTNKKEMIITPEIVPIGKMFKESYDMARADRLNLPAAIFAQAQHFKSDKFTKMGLPVPVLSTLNENFASKLYNEHYDALCLSRDIKIIGASLAVSKLIDIIISLTHGLFRSKEENQELYEVRTRKILLISNSIASTSTIIRTCITKNPKDLDIGGVLNTIAHLFLDIRFITRIRREFIENAIFERLQKEIAEIDNLYDNI